MRGWSAAWLGLLLGPPAGLTLVLVVLGMRREIRRYQPRYARWKRDVPAGALAGSAWRGVRRGMWAAVLWVVFVMVVREMAG